MAKHFGSIMEFTQERNDDIMRAFRVQLAKADYIILPRIFRLVAESPASRFWVSEQRAAVEVARMLAGKPFSRMRANKREMFEEIYRRFLLLREDLPDKSVFELVSMIVHQPAPKFYLTPRTVGEFIYRIRKGWYDKKHTGYRQDSKGE